MKFGSHIKRLGGKLTGYWFHKLSRLPRGTDLAWDIQRHWGAGSINLALDIGANAGQFSIPFHDRFPGATIHCFEPVSGTFARLSGAFKGVSNVHCHPLALGASEGEARIFVNPDDTESSILSGYGNCHEETVRITTVDKFSEAQGIQRIDFIKLDTEGYELEVLKGASGMLSNRRVRLLLVETELIPSNRHFVPLPELDRVLGAFGYAMFGVYHQQHHWDGRKSLSFVNALYAESSLVAPAAGATLSAA